MNSLNKLNKSKKSLLLLNKMNWMNYALELPSVVFLYMRPLPSLPLTIDLIDKSEILSELTNLNLADFEVLPLLHIADDLRVPNDISLVSYKGNPFMVIQTLNEGVTGERLLDKKTYAKIGLQSPPVPGSFTIEERIRYFTDDCFTVSASSDHILVFDGITLHSSYTDDFPLLEA